MWPFLFIIIIIIFFFAFHLENLCPSTFRRRATPLPLWHRSIAIVALLAMARCAPSRIAMLKFATALRQKAKPAISLHARAYVVKLA